jgi:hypothetical protein
LNTNDLDMLDARIRLQDYQKNAPKHWWIESKNQEGRSVDSRVDAHTLEIAKQMFLRQFPMHTIVKCTRILSFIEKKGTLNAL